MAYEITGVIGRDLNARDEEREHVGGFRGESVGSFLSSLTSIVEAPINVAKSFIPGTGGGRHRHHRHHRFPGGQGGQPGQGWQNQGQQQQGPWQQGPWGGNRSNWRNQQNQPNQPYQPNTLPPINIS